MCLDLSSTTPSHLSGFVIKAANCQELLDKVIETLELTEVLTLVLEEVGTFTESKDFFQLLEDDTCLMVLDFGKSWTPAGIVLLYGPGQENTKHKKDITLITFNAWKQNHWNFFGSLISKPHSTSSTPMSCDSQDLVQSKYSGGCSSWTSMLLQGLGHMLLRISSTIHHAVEGAKQWLQQQQQGGLHPY